MPGGQSEHMRHPTDVLVTVKQEYMHAGLPASRTMNRWIVERTTGRLLRLSDALEEVLSSHATRLGATLACYCDI